MPSARGFLSRELEDLRVHAGRNELAIAGVLDALP